MPNKIMSNAQIAANNIEMPDISENVPLIVKPKEKQSVEKTKTELNEKVDPINFKITNVESGKNCTLVKKAKMWRKGKKLRKLLKPKLVKIVKLKCQRKLVCKL